MPDMESTQKVGDTPAGSPPQRLTGIGESSAGDLEPAEWRRMIEDDTLDPIDALLRGFQLLQAQSARVSSQVASSIGIGPTDLRALLFIASNRGVTPKRTGDFLDLSSGAITNLVDRMVAADLVLRTPHPNDRRSLMLELAPSGVNAVNRVLDFYRRAFVTSVSHDQLAPVARTFLAIGESLERAAADEAARLRGS